MNFARYRWLPTAQSTPPVLALSPLARDRARICVSIPNGYPMSPDVFAAVHMCRLAHRDISPGCRIGCYWSVADIVEDAPIKLDLIVRALAGLRNRRGFVET